MIQKTIICLQMEKRSFPFANGMSSLVRVWTEHLLDKREAAQGKVGIFNPLATLLILSFEW